MFQDKLIRTGSPPQTPETPTAAGRRKRTADVTVTPAATAKPEVKIDSPKDEEASSTVAGSRDRKKTANIPTTPAAEPAMPAAEKKPEVKMESPEAAESPSDSEEEVESKEPTIDEVTNGMIQDRMLEGSYEGLFNLR